MLIAVTKRNGRTKSLPADWFCRHVLVRARESQPERRETGVRRSGEKERSKVCREVQSGML
jgi:hypothetical protein